MVITLKPTGFRVGAVIGEYRGDTEYFCPEVSNSQYTTWSEGALRQRRKEKSGKRERKIRE